MSIDTNSVSSAFTRHERVGFQFSGGRDSLAALHVLRPYWDRMTVYHLNTGDLLPETLEVVERVADQVPRFVTIPGRRAEVEAAFGIASDLVPVRATPIGRNLYGEPARIIGRFECCWHSLMAPMHERMLADGITLIVRGQRDADFVTPPMRSGDSDGVVEVLYPVQSWSAEDVMRFLDEQGVDPPRYYAEGLAHAPECATCAAWWDEARAPYLKRHHPLIFDEYQRRLEQIAQACAPHISEFNREISEGSSS